MRHPKSPEEREREREKGGKCLYHTIVQTYETGQSMMCSVGLHLRF